MSEIILAVVIIALLVSQYFIVKQFIVLTKLQKASTLEEYTQAERVQHHVSLPHVDNDEDMMTLDDTPADWLKEAVTRHTTNNS